MRPYKIKTQTPGDFQSPPFSPTFLLDLSSILLYYITTDIPCKGINKKGVDNVKIIVTDKAKEELAKTIETKDADKSLKIYVAGHG